MAVATTESPSLTVPTLQPLWHRAAPRRLVERCPARDPLAGWKVWQQYLARRKRPAAPPFFTGSDPALAWGWPEALQRSAVVAALRAKSALVENAIEEPAGGSTDLPLALQLVAAAYAAAELAAELPPDVWWQLAERLCQAATEAQQLRVDWLADDLGVVRHQLLAGELPLALGYLLPEIRAFRALRKPARQALSEALLELTDGQGLPHARLLAVVGPLLGCWTRARWLGQRLDRGCWSRAAETQYQWLVRHAVRLADADGCFVLAPRETTMPAWSKTMLATCLELVGDRGDFAAAEAALPRGVLPERAKFRADDLPDPSLNSDWSGLAVLANGWARSAVRLAVAYADEPVSLDLSVNGEQLLAGAWLGKTTCDGEPVQVAGEWERLCWETGKRYDFLELSAALSHGLRLDRQLLLGRHDRVLYLCDIIVSVDRKPRSLSHSMTLPLAATAAWRAEDETRDGVVVGRRARAAVLPLALSEWRADPRSGNLTGEPRRLTLSQEIHGRGLCCPLLFDFDPKRTKKQRTWRQLTVGEWLEIVPRDEAVAFRAQSGRDQWLFYRALGPAANRTFLGQNIAGEFSAGRLLETGEYKEWIEVEAV